MAEKHARSEPFIEDADLFPPDNRKRRSSPGADAPRRKAQQRGRRNSVFQYIAVMFMAAFILLLVTFLMERRQSQQQIDDLKQSVSAYQTLQGLMDDNSQLREEGERLNRQIQALESQLAAAQTRQAELEAKLQEREKTEQAMQWFWQINEASVRGRTTLCRQLITSMEEAGLQNYLPKENITDTDRFSPYDRYMEIRGLVIR